MAIRRGRRYSFFLCVAGALVAGCADEVIPGGVAGLMEGGDRPRNDAAADVSLAADAMSDAPGFDAASDGGTDAAPADATPADAEAKPADADAPPAEADATPADADTDAAPAEADTDAAPVEADATPAEADAARLAQSCVETCQGDQDCMSSQAAGAYECDLDRHRCVLCRDDLTCAGIASQWLMPCVTATDCDFFGNVCVDVDGAGRCAFTTGSPDCLGFSDDIPVTELGTSMAVVVCGDASKRCVGGSCVSRCGPQSCTPEQGGRICNDSTGQCECAGDADCAGGTGVSRCNLATKRCECSTDDDCAGVENADVCAGGKCGCSGIAACTRRRFSGTSLSCE